MPIVTLITDFGLKDGNVGVMKGVILRYAPMAHIVDLSHNIAPQNISEAALILYRSAPYFPGGSIHVVVVDPGVGTDRRPIAAQLGDQYFVGPDNGVITSLLDHTESKGFLTQFVHLNNPDYWLPQVSAVFHGRDIFSPVAGHLAAGVEINKLGTSISSPDRLSFSQPVRTEYGLSGEVIHIDHFGNISSNIRREHLGDLIPLKVKLRNTEVNHWVRTFGMRPTGDLVALYGSTDNLIISVVNGNAAERMAIKLGDRVDVFFPL